MKVTQILKNKNNNQRVKFKCDLSLNNKQIKLSHSIQMLETAVYVQVSVSL